MHTRKSKLRTCAIAFLFGLSTIAVNGYAAGLSSSVDARAEIARITGDTRNADQVKNDVLSVLNRARSAARESEIARIETLIIQVEGMGYEEILGTFSEDFVAQFSQFTSVLNNFETIQSSAKSEPAASELSSLVTTVNLRNAIYTPLCGSQRIDTVASIAILGTFLIAEAVKDAAISGCGTVVVAAGFGGSPQSAICSGAVSAVFQVARAVWEELLLCQESIDNAEILGTYQRTEDVFNSLNEHDTALKTNLDQHDTAINIQVGQHDSDIKTNLDQHDTAINIQVGQHDSDIKERLNNLEGKIDDAIMLLLTPQGKRPGWNGK